MSTGEPSFDDALLDLARFLEAIEGYLDHLVVCGGWVPYLYRYIAASSVPAHDPLLTFDFDLVAPPELPREETGTLHEHLMRGGFVAIRNREPPVVFYQHERWGHDHLAPVHGELLTPLRGSMTDRAGEPKTLVPIQDGVMAQPLRYLDLLLHEPLSIGTARVSSLSLTKDLVIRLPNPAAYAYQKALALKHRRPGKRLKDLAYIFEVAMLWNHDAAAVRDMTRSIASRSNEWAAWLERGVSVLLESFSDEHAEGPASVEQVFRSTPHAHLVSAEVVVRVVRPFIEDALTV